VVTVATQVSARVTCTGFGVQLSTVVVFALLTVSGVLLLDWTKDPSPM
jgi:hypothetical protein